MLIGRPTKYGGGMYLSEDGHDLRSLHNTIHPLTAHGRSALSKRNRYAALGMKYVTPLNTICAINARLTRINGSGSIFKHRQFQEPLPPTVSLLRLSETRSHSHSPACGTNENPPPAIMHHASPSFQRSILCCARALRAAAHIRAPAQPRAGASAVTRSSVRRSLSPPSPSSCCSA